MAESIERQIERQATDWLILLRDEPEDRTLRRQFHAWLTADPRHRAAWDEIVGIYDLLGSALTAEAFAAEAAPVAPRRRPARWRWAAAAIAAAMLVAFVLPPLLLHLNADYVTATAETRTIALADGSTVTLGPKSAIDVSVGAERRLTLLAGEMFIDVAPDAGRPFRLRALGIEAIVRGTALDIRIGEDSVDLAVRDGRVDVHYPRAGNPPPDGLAAGQWVRWTAAGRIERGDMPPQDIGAWMRGELIVRDRRLADVVADVRRSYPGLIFLPGNALKAARLTGIYRLQEPVAALQAIAAAHDATLLQPLPRTVVLTAR